MKRSFAMPAPPAVSIRDMRGCPSLGTLLICWLLVCLLSPRAYGQSQAYMPADGAALDIWVANHFAQGKLPPFSFEYGGRRSGQFIRKWTFQQKEIPSTEPDSREMRYSWTEPGGGLSVTCHLTRFNDYPAVEWMLEFSNGSAKNCPLLQKVAVIDQSFEVRQSGHFVLHHARGSNAERTDFEPMDEELAFGEHTYLTPTGGRSSDNTAFPFFNIEAPGGQGVVAAVGWTGKWYADVSQPSDRWVSLQSGMEKMQLSLYPAEQIRTPRISLLFWTGADRMIGHNQFRQFILSHHSRKINGRYAPYPLSGSFDYGDPAPCQEYNCLTEEFAVALVKRYQQFRILPEVFWLDAGWYAGTGWDKAEKGGWWEQVGNWTADPDRFPRGLRPVADAVHAAGARFMVWFEPERVRPGTRIDREHPEWLIKLKDNDNYLFDLGNKDARAWMTVMISAFIQKEGIDNYRQDFNFNPMPYWESHDKPGRIGISEIRHIEGLYAFWDSLLVRFPNLLIDNCASGGRRLDLETVSRSAPLWRTDYQYGEPNGYQCHSYGLNFYLPIHGTAIYRTDAYTFRSGLGATAVLNWEITGKASEPIGAIQQRIKDFKDLRPYFLGDYYPLTPNQDITSDDVWMAYQLNRPSREDGIVIAFRRAGSSRDSIMVKLSGLRAAENYEMYFEDYGLRVLKTGRELMDGIALTISQRPASLLIRYKITGK